MANNYHQQVSLESVPILTKYFSNGRIERFLSNDDGDELYLIDSYMHPLKKSPIVELLALKTKDD